MGYLGHSRPEHSEEVVAHDLFHQWQAADWQFRHPNFNPPPHPQPRISVGLRTRRTSRAGLGLVWVPSTTRAISWSTTRKSPADGHVLGLLWLGQSITRGHRKPWTNHAQVTVNSSAPLKNVPDTGGWENHLSSGASSSLLPKENTRSAGRTRKAGRHSSGRLHSLRCPGLEAIGHGPRESRDGRLLILQCEKFARQGKQMSVNGFVDQTGVAQVAGQDVARVHVRRRALLEHDRTIASIDEGPWLVGQNSSAAWGMWARDSS